MLSLKAATSRSSSSSSAAYERVETEDLEKGSTPATLRSPATRRGVCWSTAACWVFYTPLFAIPLTARVLSIFRHYDELTGKLEGLAFGALQDLAIFLQALLLVRLALASRESLLSSTWMTTQIRHEPPLESWGSWLFTSEGVASTAAQLFTGAMLAMAFLWATMPCLVDLALQIQYLPRLNRGFMAMFLKYSEQFSSSVTETLTPAAVFAVVMYVAWLALWVALLLLDAVQLPRFEASAFCMARDTSARSPGSDRRTSLMVRSFASSVTVRTALLSLMAFVFALHASVGLDGDGNDIRWLSNAMFQLQAENALRPPTATRAVLSVLDTPSKSIDGVDPAPSSGNVTTTSLHMASSWSVNVSTNSTVQELTVSDPHPALHPVARRLISEQEDFEPLQEPVKHPFWRKTKGYRGSKRFDIRYNSSSTPPDIILINMESFRSLDVGVIGARAKKAAANQTVTPFFDQLSESGVLFRQHYTPCVQTSRTLLTSLFGTMPSLTEWSALATYDETQLRVHGLPQILKQKLNYQNVFWSAVNLGWENWASFLSTHGFDKLVDEHDAVTFLPEQRRSELDEDDSFSWGRHDKISLEALEHFLEQRHQQQDEQKTPRQPLFLDVYTISSHDPWVLPKSFSPSTNYSTFITDDNEKYLHALNYVDQAIAQLVTNLRRKGLLRNTVLLLEGDHGYGRMEHDDPTVVASFVYDEGSHIPMLLVADDLLPTEQRGMVVDALTSQTDLQATITDMLGLRDFMQHGMGQSMMRKTAAEIVGTEEVGAELKPNVTTVNGTVDANASVHTPSPSTPRTVLLENPFYGTTKGLRVGDLKYVHYSSGSYEVFNLTADPMENHAIEKGRVDSVKNSETASELRFLDQAIAMIQTLYETNAFVPDEEADA